MNKNVLKIVCITLSAVLICSGTIAAVFASGNNQSIQVDSENTSETTASQTENENKTVNKNETVYVIAGADGSVQKLIVSDWLKNTLNNQVINDQSELTGIENVKGEESYSANGNSIVWDAAGNDIYYQGNIEKEIPVSMKISYTLDGQLISASDIAGKSGKVTIRFDYTNNQYEMVEIDGQQHKIYIPFAMLTGVLLDNNVFSNIQVSNGKIISDGDRTAVVGIAFPGLSENLALDSLELSDSESIEIPSYIEITADVKDFSMTSTVTVSTNSIFNKINDDIFDKADDLKERLGELSEAVGQLIDGSSDLYNGVCTLLDKSSELVDGINKLAEGAQKIKDGSTELVNGAATLSDGADKLSAGLQTIISNNEKINGGAKTVFETLLKTADTQLVAAGITGVPSLTIENYKEVLSGVIESLNEDTVRAQANNIALQTVTQQVEDNRESIKAGVTQAVREQVEAQVTETVRESVKVEVLASMGMTPETYAEGISAGVISEAQQQAVESAVDAQMQSDTVKTTIAENTDNQMETESILQLIDTKTNDQVNLLIEQNMSSQPVVSQIEAAVNKAREGVVSINSLIEQLDSYKEFYNGLAKYTAGVTSASKGADDLKDGASDIYDGCVSLNKYIAELLQGIITMKDNTPVLVSGVEKLKEGAMQLNGGLKEFNEQGVQKIVNAVGDNIESFVTRFRATIDVSKDYTSFSGISDDMDGNVKFVYRTESINSKQ